MAADPGTGLGVATDLLSRERLLKQRWGIAIAFVVLTMVGVVASVSSWWAHRVLFDTDTWMETVGPIGTNEVVTDALSDRFSTVLIDWIDAENRLEGLLPPILAPLASYGSGFINDAIVRETDEFFASELYANSWYQVNETAHSTAVAIIRDELPNASTAEGVVTVDLVPFLTPIVDRVFAGMTALGDAIPDVLLDQVNVDETVAAIIDNYETEGLPDSLRAVEVYSSERLAAVQRTAVVLDALVWVFPFLSVAFAAGALYFAPRRSWMAAILFGAAALGWFLTWLGVTVAVDAIVSGIKSQAASDVAGAVFQGVTDGLTTLLVVLAVAGTACALAVVGWAYYSGRVDDHSPSPTT